ncbi:MAG: lipoprotein intramolecular transacylase Lit [Solirubrobacterales bacterium]
MRPKLAAALAALIVAAVPAVLIGNALWVMINPWLVHAQYAIPGFPDDAFGLSDAERTDLALTGVDSIRPGTEGTELLREARLPSGGEAFDQREIDHMQDVRELMAAFFVLWAAAVVAGIAAALALGRLGYGNRVTLALKRGAVLTLAAMAVAGLVMLIDFEFFFDGLHGILFEDETWEFNETYLLRQIYPDFFWGVAGAAIAAAVALQALVLFAAFRARAPVPVRRS